MLQICVLFSPRLRAAILSMALPLCLTSCANSVPAGSGNSVTSGSSSSSTVLYDIPPKATARPDRPDSSNDEAIAKLKNGDPNDRVTVQEVTAVAADADKGFADGWIDGREARIFKSYYRVLPPLEKAQFAMAYHDMVEKSDQNLAQSYKTYIPYKTRVAFARHYWETSNQGVKFKSEIEKMQIAWIHESLLDGSELWWRAAETRFGNRIDSPTQMAHDVEQNMVSKYMEDENTESTFSQQMSIKTPGKKTN